MSTIRSPREIDRVFRTARRIRAHHFIALVAPTPPGRDPEGRVACVAGKKLGGAVVRNRAKRVLRAAARAAGGAWPSLDVVLVARPATAQASSLTVADEMKRVLTREAVSCAAGHIR